jgi:MerR family mercuric resistance operon transcriptional regulator
VSCGEFEKLAQAHLRSVREKITDLKRMERVLSETVRSCSGEDVPECPLWIWGLAPI